MRRRLIHHHRCAVRTSSYVPIARRANNGQAVTRHSPRMGPILSATHHAAFRWSHYSRDIRPLLGFSLKIQVDNPFKPTQPLRALRCSHLAPPSLRWLISDSQPATGQRERHRYSFLKGSSGLRRLARRSRENRVTTVSGVGVNAKKALFVFSCFPDESRMPEADINETQPGSPFHTLCEGLHGVLRAACMATAATSITNDPNSPVMRKEANHGPASNLDRSDQPRSL